MPSGPAVRASFVAQGVPTFRMGDGKLMPQLGFGTYRITPGASAKEAVAGALAVAPSGGQGGSDGTAYAHIDTAALYRNEADCGDAVRDYLAGSPGMKRENLFVTTKLWNSDHGRGAALQAGEKSFKRLDVGYIDLYLMHSPFGGRILETYQEMLQLQAKGLVGSVGVSNFGVPHLELIRRAGLELPAVNQIEMHPLIRKERQALIDYCRQHGILIVAYGSIFAGYPKWLGHKSVKLAAASAILKDGRTSPVTPAQALLRWSLDWGFAVIPKSVTPSRIVENAQVFDFELSTEGRAALDGMSGQLGDYWDPLDAPIGDEDLQLARAPQAHSGRVSKR